MLFETTSYLIEKFATVRNQTITLIEPLEAEDFIIQASSDVSPPKWHIAHTTWFFERMILQEFILQLDWSLPASSTTRDVVTSDRRRHHCLPGICRWTNGRVLEGRTDSRRPTKNRSISRDGTTTRTTTPGIDLDGREV